MLWTRRFAALSLLCVLATASVSAVLLSRNVAERMVWRNAELAQEFLDSLVRMQHGDALFTRAHDPKGFEALFGELARMPGLVHTNVFDLQRRLGRRRGHRYRLRRESIPTGSSNSLPRTAKTQKLKRVISGSPCMISTCT